MVSEIMGIKMIKCLLLCICLSPCWSFHLWKNKDQQAYDLFQAKHFGEAQALFNSNEWKGVAAYRNKDYAQAIKYLSQVQNAEAYYNMGNSYAHLGHLEEAIKAYRNAILIDPQHVDAVNNLQVLEKEIQRQEEERTRQEEEQKRQEERKRQEEARQREEEQKQKKAECIQQEEECNLEEEACIRQKQECMRQIEQKTDNKEHPRQSMPSGNQQNQEWLNFIDEDPGAFLKHKFLRDYQKAQQQGRI